MPPNLVKQKVEELAKTVREKLGESEQKVLDQWEQELALVAELRNDLSKEEQEKRAFLRLRGFWKRELRSPAKFYEGIIVRVAPPFDVLRSMHAAAQLIYEKDPQKAIAEGWTDDQGHTLDNRRKFQTGRVNSEFGKVIPDHRYIQNITGIAKSSEMQKPMVFTMVLSERKAGKIDIPIYTPVRFRANPAQQQPNDGTLTLNEYSGLKFASVEVEGFPSPEELLHQYFDDCFVAPEDLPDWHKSNKDDPQRFALVEGYVDDVDPTANPATGNARAVIVDDDGETEIVVWIPAHLRHLVNFGASSRIIAGGRTTQQEFNEEERTMLNCESLLVTDNVPQEEAPSKVVSSAQEVK